MKSILVYFFIISSLMNIKVLPKMLFRYIKILKRPWKKG